MPEPTGLILWSAPDGSWGACLRDDLIMVAASEIDADTQAEIEHAQDTGADPREIIAGLLRSIDHVVG